MIRAEPERLLNLLARLEEHWRAVDAPVVGLLRPGLSAAEVDEATAPLGLRLPLEARTLFGWHDGTTFAPGVRRDIGPAFAFMPLQWQVEQCQQWRRFAADLLPAGLTGLWEDSWFPLMAGIIDASTNIIIDTSVRAGEVAPCGFSDKEDVKPPTRERTFTDIVQLWVDCLDSGTYSYSPEDHMWLKPWPLSTLPKHLKDFYL